MWYCRDEQADREGAEGDTVEDGDGGGVTVSEGSFGKSTEEVGAPLASAPTLPSLLLTQTCCNYFTRHSSLTTHSLLTTHYSPVLLTTLTTHDALLSTRYLALA